MNNSPVDLIAELFAANFPGILLLQVRFPSRIFLNNLYVHDSSGIDEDCGNTFSLFSVYVFFYPVRYLRITNMRTISSLFCRARRSGAFSSLSSFSVQFLFHIFL